MNFHTYLKDYPLYSHKKKRFYLIPRFYDLKNQRAYRQNVDSFLYKDWVQLEKDWNTF